MTVYEAHRFITGRLQDIYDQRESGNIAAMVMEKITGLGRSDRLLIKDQPLSEEQDTLLTGYTTQLLQHRPVQYVLGEAWFYGMPFYVDENVLIPRPETEELAEWVIKDAGYKLQGTGYRAQGAGGGPAILDIGTGSGCIAIALKKNIPESEVYAIDISDKALAVAQKNALILECPVQFSQMDFLHTGEHNTLPLLDIIVSNPPYIPLKDKAEMHKNVLGFEPHTALFVEDSDPLVFYSAIAAFAMHHLQPDGYIYTEIHEAMGEAVKEVFIHHGFIHTTIQKDMQGKDRMIKTGKTN